MTYEMIYQMFLKEDMRDQLLENVNSLIIDEAHLMEDRSREIYYRIVDLFNPLFLS